MAKIMGKESYATEEAARRAGEKKGKEVVSIQKLPSGRFTWVAEDKTLSFQNGYARAEKEIQNKMLNAGMKVENVIKDKNGMVRQVAYKFSVGENAWIATLVGSTTPRAQGDSKNEAHQELMKELRNAGFIVS